MSDTPRLTLSLPETPRLTLAEGVLHIKRPVTGASLFARFKGEGGLTARTSLDVGWAYPKFTGSGTLSAQVSVPIIPVNAQFGSTGTLSTTTSGVHKVYAGFTGNGVAQATAERMKVSFTDDFERADGSIGSDYFSPISAALPVIYQGTVRAPSVSSTALYPASYVYPLTTDNQRVTAVIATPSNEVQSELYLRAPQTGPQHRAGGGAVLAIWEQQLGIFTIASDGTATQRVLNSDSPHLVTGDVVEFTANNGVYVGYVNTVPVVSWTDPGGVVIKGPTRRYVGFTQTAYDSKYSTTFHAFNFGDL